MNKDKRMKTDHPKERDLFSVKGRDLFSKKSKEGTKRKKGEDDVSLSKGKKRKQEENEVEFDESISYVPMSYERVPVGQVVLGCILKVFKYEIIVSLPNRIQGHLPIMNVSKSYNDLLAKISGKEDLTDTFYNLEEIYSTGQLIITKIKSVLPYEDGTSKITLSILPEDVNKELSTSALCENSIVQSEVLSEEENGYIMNTGMRNIRAAFLPKEQAPAGTVGIGSVFLCSVKKIFNKSDKEVLSLSLSAEPFFMNTCLTLSDNLNITSIVPGSLIQAKVNKVLVSGLELSINNFRGFASISHLKSHQIKKKKYKVGQTVKARVLYFQDLDSVVYCSLNSKLCSQSVLSRNSNEFSIGDVCSATVSKKSADGIHFTIGKNEDGHGFISKGKSKLAAKKLLKNMEVGLKVTCRVRHVHLIDQLYILSLETKQSLEREELFAGKLVRVKIAEHTDTGALGLIVGIGKVGFIPKMHFPNPDKSQGEEICRVGEKYEARILKYTPDKDLQLTLKEELVSCNLPLVTEFSDKFVGCVTMGSIVKLYTRAILVHFFDAVKALIPIHQIPDHMQNNYNEFFRLGSVVKCRIATLDSEQKKMTASLFLVDSQKKKIEASQLYNTENDSGLVVKQCKVYSIENEALHVHIDGFKGNAYIPWYHIADNIKMSRAIFSLLKVGDEIENAVVFSQTDAGYVLSMKPSLYQHLKDVTNEDDPIKIGSIRPSVITEIFDNRIAVATNGADTKHYIQKDCMFAEEVTSTTNVGIQKGQTLLIKCIRAEKEKPLKFVSNLKSVMPNCRSSSLQLLYDTISVDSQIRKMAFERNKFNLDKIAVGNSLTGKVVFVCEAGALVRIPDISLEGVIHPSHYSKSGVPKLNKTIQIRVLNSNYKEMCLELTAREDIKKFFSISDPDIEVGQEASCEVLVANKDYIIGCLDSLCEGQIVYLPSRRHINDFKSRQTFYEIGKKYEVVIEHVADSFVLANLKVHTEMDLIDMKDDHPCVNFKELPDTCSSNSFILDENLLTKHDFITKAKLKIETVSKFKKDLKTGAADSHTSKWDALQDDNFSQHDDQLYWEGIVQERKERKKLKRKTLGRIKVRKASVGDESNLTETNSDVEESQINTKNKNSKKKEKLKINEMKQDKIKEKTKRVKNNEDKESIVPAKRQKMETKEEEKEETLHANFLKVPSSGFDWSGGQNSKQINLDEDEDSISSEEEHDEDNEKKKSVKRLSKAEKTAKKILEEKKIREVEANPNQEPETAADFELKVEINPDSSEDWIAYIGFYLENSETSKARTVASRGLKTMKSTLTEERLALWNVTLRLEVMYGTEDSIQTTFQEALVLNDELKIYFMMIEIYFNANKVKEAKELLKKLVKKFSQTRDVWIRAFNFLFKANEINEARTMLDKSLLSLPKKDHVEIINRFAQLELKHGDSERGKTIFEKLLSNFPKRLDVWNVYADLLLKHNDIAGSRNVLERITGLKLKMKPMRNAFKKLMEFEKQHGTPLRVEAVKKMVEDYVTSALKDDDE